MGRPLTGTVKAFGAKFRASHNRDLCPVDLGAVGAVHPTWAPGRSAHVPPSGGHLLLRHRGTSGQQVLEAATGQGFAAGGVVRLGHSTEDGEQ